MNKLPEEEGLPEIVAQLCQEHPDVWDAYNQLGKALADAGPLADKTQRLVKIGLAVGAGLEGAVRAHTRRAIAAGLSAVELRQAALLGVTTVGWPRAVAGLSWIDEELGKQSP